MRQKTAVLLLFTAATAMNLANQQQSGELDTDSHGSPETESPPLFAGIDLNENGLGDFEEAKSKADQDVAEAQSAAEQAQKELEQAQ